MLHYAHQLVAIYVYWLFGAENVVFRDILL